jgi:hypothetical protein
MRSRRGDRAPDRGCQYLFLFFAFDRAPDRGVGGSFSFSSAGCGRDEELSVIAK